MCSDERRLGFQVPLQLSIKSLSSNNIYCRIRPHRNVFVSRRNRLSRTAIEMCNVERTGTEGVDDDDGSGEQYHSNLSLIHI